jgi:hypothetical protein
MTCGDCVRARRWTDDSGILLTDSGTVAGLGVLDRGSAIGRKKGHRG